MHAASLNRNIEVIALLLQENADIEALGHEATPLYHAVLIGNLEAIKELLSWGAFIDQKAIDWARSDSEMTRRYSEILLLLRDHLKKKIQ